MYLDQILCIKRFVIKMHPCCQVRPGIFLGNKKITPVFRPGRHLPPDQGLTKPDMEMKLKWSQTSHVKADTINRQGKFDLVSFIKLIHRFVPTPGGVTIGADKFNPALDMVHREDLNPNFPR